MIEVKGIWFVSLRTWAERELGAAAIARLCAAMPEHGGLVDTALASEWYPEDALLELLRALRKEAGHDERRFVEMARRCSHEAVGRFFRVILGLTSPRFLLKQVPTLWRRIRRGDQVAIEVDTDDVGGTIHYRGFPYFRHEEYLWLTEGSLRALVELSGGSKVTVRCVGSGADHASFRIDYA